MAKAAAGQRRWLERCESGSRLEEMEDIEMIEVSKDNEEEEVWSHFAVLAEDHWDAFGVLMTTLDMLSMDFLTFQQDSWNISMDMLKLMGVIAHELQRANDLKEEEMGKEKGKEKAEGESKRRRTEDKDRDMEMGRAGPSSLV
ncbi:hypothetical protein ID866_8807 [Astraeus odoratus]|nr:hypothetical protein ID866_8807 [Astraeus odoratus]